MRAVTPTIHRAMRYVRPTPKDTTKGAPTTESAPKVYWVTFD